MAFGRSFFSHFSCMKAAFYVVIVAFVTASLIIVALEPFIALPCTETTIHDAPNPFYQHNPCRQIRYARLCFLTSTECAYGRRQVIAVLLGGVIGWERRTADRPAGIRTMALVSLGSCLFTLCGAMAFIEYPMTWDASRISAAIPSGVGFLGAGLIWKSTIKNDVTGESTQIVHGLTTAASVWLSAAVGIACGGGMYFAATFGTSLMLLLLRFGPRIEDIDDGSEEDASDVPDPMEGYGAVGSLDDRRFDKKLAEVERPRSNKKIGISVKPPRSPGQSYRRHSSILQA